MQNSWDNYTRICYTFFEQEQTLVLAHYFQGKTLPQLADEFRENLNTLQKRKERVLYRLQDDFDELGE